MPQNTPCKIRNTIKEPIFQEKAHNNDVMIKPAMENKNSSRVPKRFPGNHLKEQ